MKLINEQTGLEVKVGDLVKDFLGHEAILIDYKILPAPSSGRVYLQYNRTKAFPYYPSVIGCKLVD